MKKKKGEVVWLEERTIEGSLCWRNRRPQPSAACTWGSAAPPPVAGTSAHRRQLQDASIRIRATIQCARLTTTFPTKQKKRTSAHLVKYEAYEQLGLQNFLDEPPLKWNVRIYSYRRCQSTSHFSAFFSATMRTDLSGALGIEVGHSSQFDHEQPGGLESGFTKERK